MSYHSNDVLLADREIALPLFLSRASARVPLGLLPPPLPKMQRTVAETIIGLLWVRRGPVSLSLCAAVVVLAIVAVASSHQLSGEKPRIAAATLISPPKLVHTTLTQAFDLVAVVESRLTYATRLGDHLNAADAVKLSPQEAADAIAFAMAGGGEKATSEDGGALQSEPDQTESEQVALFVVRGVPANATFLEGASMGDGVWAVPARDVADLSAKLGDGFDAEIWSEVEMVSQAGVTVRTARITLHKDAGVPLAATSGEGTNFTTGSLASDQAVAAPVTKETVAEAEDETVSQVAAEASAKTSKRRRHARLRRTSKNAVASQEQNTRNAARVADAWSPGTTRGTTRSQLSRARAMGVGAPKQEDDDKPGIISKFVTWLKGSSTTDDTASSETASATVAAPAPKTPFATDESSLSGLGMFQSSQ
ncbi:MAG: hypothetical protein AB7S74_01600 [Hyphomicrobium sp.]